MVDFGTLGARILGFGHAQPERILTNDDIAKLVDTNDEWIRTRTGIEQRHIVGEGESVVSLATAAASMALSDSGVDPADISLVIVASTTSDNRSPNAAGRVSVLLGLDAPAVIDVNTACSGFEYALGIADQAVRAGSARFALVIGAETLSTVTDWTDRSTCVLTADGAGAVVIGRSEPAGISTTVWGSVPELVEAVRVDGSPQRFSQEGRAIFRWAITEAKGHADRVLAAAGVRPEQIDVLALHQANLRIIEPIAEALQLRDDAIVIRDVVVSGNTSAASVPLGLSKAWHRGELPAGGLTLLFGFGGGFAFAGQLALLPERAAK